MSPEPFQMSSRTTFTAKHDSWRTYNSTIADGQSSPYAKVTYRSFKDAGTITFSRISSKYLVTHKSFSDEYHLCPANNKYSQPQTPSIAVATKKGILNESLELKIGNDRYVVKQARSLSRSYEVYRIETPGDRHSATQSLVGELKAAGVSASRYTLSFENGIPFELPAFSFWLVNMLNRSSLIECCTEGFTLEG